MTFCFRTIDIFFSKDIGCLNCALAQVKRVITEIFIKYVLVVIKLKVQLEPIMSYVAHSLSSFPLKDMLSSQTNMLGI
jgi:hypothetical protein